MGNQLERDTLTRAIEEFSLPFETIEETKTMSIKLDALVSDLLKTSFAEQRVGPERLRKLSDGTSQVPAILREVGGEPFNRAAKLAELLLAISRAYVLDIGGSGINEILDEANTSREAFYKAFQDLLPSIVD